MLFVVAQDDWLRLVRDSHVPALQRCPEKAWKTRLTLTLDNADQYLEEDLQGQVRHKVDHCCEVLFYRFLAPLSFAEWTLLVRYSKRYADVAVKQHTRKLMDYYMHTFSCGNNCYTNIT